MARLAFVKNPRRVNFYLPSDLIEAAKAHAVTKRRSVSAVVADALHEHIPKKTLVSMRANTAPTKTLKEAKRK